MVAARKEFPARARQLGQNSRGTGSEVSLCVAAYEQLTAQGVPARVVSMPSWELCEAQPEEYRHAVLPPAITARQVAVEAAAQFGWDRYLGPTGRFVGMHGYGANRRAAPASNTSALRPSTCWRRQKRCWGREYYISVRKLPFQTIRWTPTLIANSTIQRIDSICTRSVPIGRRSGRRPRKVNARRQNAGLVKRWNHAFSSCGVATSVIGVSLFTYLPSRGMPHCCAAARNGSSSVASGSCRRRASSKYAAS